MVTKTFRGEKLVEENRRKGRLNCMDIREITKLCNWNIQGKLSRRDMREQLAKEMFKKRIAVGLFQETRCNDDFDENYGDFGRIINIAGRSDNPNKKYGLAFYIHPSWAHMYQGFQYVSDRIAIIRFKALKKSERPMTLFNIYAPTTRYTRVGDVAEIEEFYELLAVHVKEHKSKASLLFVGGDFNSKIGQMKEEDDEIMGRFTKGWRNKHGEYLAEFLKDTKLFLCNTAFRHRDHHRATWHGAKRTIGPDGKEIRVSINNQIDFMAILQRHKSMVTNSRSYQGERYESDHSMVITEVRILSIYPVSRSKVVHERLRDLAELHRNPEVGAKYEVTFCKNFRSSLDEKFQEKIAAGLPAALENEAVLGILGESMKKAIEATVPLAPKKVGARIIYDQDPKLKSMSEWRKKLWRRWRDPRVAEATRQASYSRRKEVFKAMRDRVRELNTIRMEHIASELEASSGNGGNRATFEYARMLSKKKFVRFSIIIDGFEDTNPLNILEPLRAFNLEKFNMAGVETLDPWRGEPRPLDNPITLEETAIAIARLNNNRAMGPDKIPTEWVKYGGLGVAEIIMKIFNKMFEYHDKLEALTEGILIPMNKPKEKHTMDKTRGITLLNTIRKVFTNLGNARMVEKLEAYLPPSQHGYRARRSTTEMAFAAQMIRAMVDKYKEKYNFVGTDLTAAFDRALRQLLMTILKDECLFNEDELRMVQVMMSGTILRIRIGGEMGEPFETRVGVPQGDSLSPMLFNVYMEYISREYKRQCSKKPRDFDIRMTYADDDNFYIHDTMTGVEGPCNYNCQCSRCQQEEILWKMPVVMDVANMLMNPKKTALETLDKQNRGEKLKLKQVGTLLDSSAEVKLRIAKGYGALAGMTNLWLKGNPISLKTKLRLFKVTALQHMLYNIHVAPLTQREMESLNIAHRRYLRKILGVYWPNILGVSATYKATLCRPIAIDIILRRWLFLGHILRGNVKAPAYLSLLLYFTHTVMGKERECYRGRPFANLPQIFNNEFKWLTHAQRIALTGGALGGILEFTTKSHLLQLRKIANDDREGHGVKWRKLARAIEDAAQKVWNKKERVRI